MDREQQSTRGATGATPPKSQSKAPAKTAPAKQTRAKGAGGPQPPTSAPDIMSRLPKSRPQRASQRRRAPVGASTKAPAARAATASGKAATSPKQSKRPAATAGRRAASPSASTGASGATAARRGASTGQGAPGLPRLAIDGAAEAVKLPLKVGGRLTLKALDAVARGLRRR